MNIKEIRQKYPQYNDLSDDQLLQGLHQKYYSDMPIEQFMENFQQQAPESRSISEQFKRGLGRTGRIAADTVAAFPLTIMDAGVGARNLYSELSNLNREPLSSEPLKETYPSYSSMYKEAMDQTPLPPAEGLGEEIVDIAGQVLLGGKVMPNIGIKNPAPQVIQPKAYLADQAIKAGAKHDVPVYYDDVAGNVAKRIGVAAERVPLAGTGGGRAAQQSAINQATQKIAGKHYIDDDIPELVQKGLQEKLNNARKAVGVLYDRVAVKTDPIGHVFTGSFDDVLTSEMAKQEKLGTAANPEVMKALEKYASAPRGNFSFLRQLRSQLGKDISNFYKGGGAIGEEGVGALQAVKNALEKDMGKAADDAGPTAKAAWLKANAFYKKMVVPYKQVGLRSLVKTDEPMKAWRYLMQQSAGKERADKMYLALNNKGRAAVRSGVILDAVEYAKTPKGDVSPAKFAQYMEKHTNAINSFFKGRDAAELEGFRNLMRHVERAGQYAENPPTGQRIIDTAAGAGIIGALLSPEILKLMAGIGATAGTVKVMFQTQVGRDVLISMSKMKPGTPAFNNAAKYLAATVATQSKP